MWVADSTMESCIWFWKQRTVTKLHPEILCTVSLQNVHLKTYTNLVQILFRFAYLKSINFIYYNHISNPVTTLQRTEFRNKHASKCWMRLLRPLPLVADMPEWVAKNLCFYCSLTQLLVTVPLQFPLFIHSILETEVSTFPVYKNLDVSDMMYVTNLFNWLVALSKRCT